MGTFQIAELARRTGFSRPTLRYYEEIGLLEQAERSASGYRMYGDDDAARLDFIRRAKHLGLSLEEIRTLVEVWAGGECTATRQRVRELVDHKILTVRAQLHDCATFLGQLEAVSDRLATGPASAEGCDCAPELPPIDPVHSDHPLHDRLSTKADAMSTSEHDTPPTSDTTCSCGCETSTNGKGECSCGCAPDPDGKGECSCGCKTDPDGKGECACGCA
ncbi:hypothetical protein BH23ACT9_BH23ACT9_34750 [soil metagenome]